MRKIWLDYIKITAAFFVVLQHTISPVWTGASPDTPVWIITNFLFVPVRSAVVLFFMCSGAGILRRPHSIKEVLWKNIFPLLKVYFFWMLIYGFFDCISLFQTDQASLSTVVNAFLKSILFGKYHTWFLFALIGLYLITPFLYSVVESRSRMQYFLLLSVFFTVLLPVLKSIQALDRLTANLENFNMHFVVGYILYFVLGYYISTVEWKKSYTVLSLLLTAITCFAAFVYSTAVSVSTNTAFQDVYSEFSPLGFLFSISFFAMFRGLFQKRKANRISTILIQCGMGVYLLHPLLLSFFTDCSGLMRILLGIFVYLVCIFICILINKNRSLRSALLKV